jgi:hypothetical protein
MNSKKTCNRDQKLFNNNLKQFAIRHVRGDREIVYYDDEKYLKIFKDGTIKDNFKKVLIDSGPDVSQRKLEVRYIFNSSKEAEKFITEIRRKNLCCLFTVNGQKGAWIVMGSIIVQLDRMSRAIKKIERTINKYHTYRFIDCASIRNWD